MKGKLISSYIILYIQLKNPFNKIRGSKKAIKKIISDLESNDLDNDVPVILIEVDNPEVTNALETYLIENKVNYILSPVGTTVCIHSGRKCCGLVFLNK